MAIWRAVILNVVEQTVGNFENSLVGNILIGPNGGCKVSLEIQDKSGDHATTGSQTHWIPNLMPLNRFGNLSTSCCLTGLSADVATAIFGSSSKRLFLDVVGLKVGSLRKAASSGAGSVGRYEMPIAGLRICNTQWSWVWITTSLG